MTRTRIDRTARKRLRLLDRGLREVLRLLRAAEARIESLELWREGQRIERDLDAAEITAEEAILP